VQKILQKTIERHKGIHIHALKSKFPKELENALTQNPSHYLQELHIVVSMSLTVCSYPQLPQVLLEQFGIEEARIQTLV
jgi:hypothetical protein